MRIFGRALLSRKNCHFCFNVKKSHFRSNPFQEPRFQSLSTDAKTLYGILLDRMSLSVKNGWLDEQNRVFILFTISQSTERDAGVGSGAEKRRTIFCRGKGNHRENTDPINEHRRGFFPLGRCPRRLFLYIGQQFLTAFCEGDGLQDGAQLSLQ